MTLSTARPEHGEVTDADWGGEIHDAVEELQAVAATASEQGEVTAGGTTTSTSYTASLTGSGGASTTFVAPPSGKVWVHWSANLHNNTAGQDARVSWEVRTGAVVGSGTVEVAADDTRSIRIKAASTTNDAAFGRSRLVSNLTPGTTYNVRQMFKVSGGTGNFLDKVIGVQPAA